MREYDGLTWIKAQEIESNFVASRDKINDVIKSGHVRYFEETIRGTETTWVCVLDLRKLFVQAAPSNQRIRDFADNVGANILGSAVSGPTSLAILGGAMALIAKEVNDIRDLVEGDLPAASMSPVSSTQSTSDEAEDDYLEHFGYVTTFSSRTGKGVLETIGEGQLVGFQISDVDTSDYNFPIKKGMLMSFDIVTENSMSIAKNAKTLPPETIEYIIGEG